jgi:hypothetical protein
MEEKGRGLTHLPLAVIDDDDDDETSSAAGNGAEADGRSARPARTRKTS